MLNGIINIDFSISSELLETHVAESNQVNLKVVLFGL